MAKTIYREEYRELVNRLRGAREALNLSQTDLAQRLGRNQQWVSLMESGSRRLDVVEFAEVCLALDVDPLGTLSLVTGMLAQRKHKIVHRRQPRPAS